MAKDLIGFTQVLAQVLLRFYYGSTKVLLRVYCGWTKVLLRLCLGFLLTKDLLRFCSGCAEDWFATLPLRVGGSRPYRSRGLEGRDPQFPLHSLYSFHQGSLCALVGRDPPDLLSRYIAYSESSVVKQLLRWVAILRIGFSVDYLL